MSDSSAPFRTTDVPPYLWQYLSKYLKVIAILVDSEGKEQWGIFFAKDWEGDGDYEGTVKTQDGGEPTKWKTPMPICLLPLTRVSREIAMGAFRKEGVPRIKADKLHIVNKGSKDGKNWNSYVFWLKEGAENWEDDAILHLDPQTVIEPLHKKMRWRLYGTPTGKQDFWPLCFSLGENENDIKHTDRLVAFPAPKCQIVDDATGKYLEHQIWFGCNIGKPIKNDDGPFMAMDKTEPSPKDGTDCPIVWGPAVRNDDVLIPAKQKVLGVDDWKEAFPILKLSSNTDDRIKDILKDFGKGHDRTLKSWVIRESPENKGQPNIPALHAIYLRHFEVTEQTEDERRRGTASLKAIIGKGTDDSKTSQIVRLIQVSRGKKSSILLRLRYPYVLFEGKSDSLWNRKMKVVANGIRAVSGSKMLGIVPLIETQFLENDAHYIAEWESDSSDICSIEQKQYSLVKSAVFNNGPEETRIVDIDLPLLHTSKLNQRNTPVKLSNCEIHFDAGQLVSDNGTLFHFTLGKYEAEDYRLIDGALAFTLDNGDGKHGRFRLTLQLEREQKPFFLWNWHPKFDEEKKDRIVLNYAIENFSLAVKKVEAAGQDSLDREKFLAPQSLGAVVEGMGERTEPALVIPIDSETPDGEHKYFLSFSESVSVGQNHRVDIRLEEADHDHNKDKSTQIKAVILDTHPQLVAMVDARFLQQPGYDDGAWVLARRSPISEENGGWELLDDSAGTLGFNLVLPSQAIGEAYVKGKPGQSGTVQPGEPGIHKAIDYRFGAPALLRLASERLEKRYVAVPWNLRRNLGQPGDAAPGIPLLELYFELLYGLPGHISPQKKAFLSELASKLGDVPTPPVNNTAWEPTGIQQEAFTETWIQYLKFYRAWKSRLAILEPSAENDFKNTTVDQGISFAPRIGFKSSAAFKDMLEGLLTYVNAKYPDWTGLPVLIESVEVIKSEIGDGPDYGVIVENRNRIIELLQTKDEQDWIGKLEHLSHLEKVGASLRYPLDNIAALNKYADNLLEEQIRAAHEKKGLAGGFHYGFESNAIYKEFWREALSKRSSSAEVKSLAFSSLGGWGIQAARFASDKTVIRSVTTMGRTQFYAVERIGRIGVFWHKAKHVIEYERTVVPSIQFKEYQPQHPGRVLVRKVREYIEILEPRRNYPDFNNDVQDAPGSVTSCTFKSRIIPVLSAWGHDVWGNEDQENGPPKKGTIGWEVPLWKAGADPKVYPKPQIVLSLLPPPDSDEKAILYNLSEPENLWFYTDTRAFVVVDDKQKIPITSDVHAWPAVRHVDYPNLPEPEQYDIAPAMGDGSGGLELPMPGVLDIMPGFERYTFRVDRNEIPASVAGKYYPKASITGRMRTVSMMRSWPVKEAEKQKWYAAGGEARTALRHLVNGKESVLSKTANGLDGILVQLQAGKIPSKHDIRDSIKGWFVSEGDTLNKSLRELKKTSVAKPRLNYFDDLWQYADGLSSYPAKWLWRESLEAADGIVGRTIRWFEKQRNLLTERLIELGQKPEQEALDELERFQNRVIDFQTDVEFTIDSVHTTILKTMDLALARVPDLNVQVTDEVMEFLDKLDLSQEIEKVKDQTVTKAKEALGKIEEQLIGKNEVPVVKPKGLLGKFEKIAPDKWSGDIEKISDEIRSFIAKSRIDIENLGSTAQTGIDFVRQAKSELYIIFNKLNNEVQTHLHELRTKIGLLTGGAKTGMEDVTKQLKEINKRIAAELSKAIQDIKAEWEREKRIELNKINADLDTLQLIIQVGILKEYLGTALYNPGQPCVFEILRTLDGMIKKLEDIIKSSLLEVFCAGNAEVEQWLETLDEYRRLMNVIKTGNIQEIIKETAQLGQAINKEMGRLVSEVSQRVKDVEQLGDAATDLVQTGRQTLTNFRSVWEEFTAPGMGLNRKTVALILNTNPYDIEQRLTLTPCISKVKEFGQALEGLGLRMPVVAITDRLLPSRAEWNNMQQSLLRRFDFSSIMSDIGGVRFDGLFPGLKMPEFARDTIKIKQGFDRQNLTAWIDAEASVLLKGKKKLMNIGPLQIELENGLFTGKVRIEVDIDGKIKKVNSGQLTGSWHINIAGTGLIIFRDTSVIFRDGKLRFDLDPKRMEMPGLLKMLTDATTKLSEGGAGGNAGSDGSKAEVFKVGVVKVHEIPAGVRAQLDIPPVSVGGGVSALTNLSFGGHFELLALDKNLNFKFLLGLGFYMGKKEMPFNLTIFILGGGGYVTCDLTYTKDGLAVDFVMSVHASAALAVALGWMTGMIAIMVGFEGEYHRQPARSGSVYVTIFVRVVGVVDILGLITIFLYLSLEATYRAIGNSSQLVGTGEVRVEIRICRFIKIKVRRRYTKVFTGADSKNNAFLLQANAGNGLPEHVQKANNILQSLA